MPDVTAPAAAAAAAPAPALLEKPELPKAPKQPKTVKDPVENARRQAEYAEAHAAWKQLKEEHKPRMAEYEKAVRAAQRGGGDSASPQPEPAREQDERAGRHGC